MPSDIRMPQLGMNQDSAVIVGWLKTVGDKVVVGEPIFEVETDKATMEVEAVADGFLAAIWAEQGANVPVGDVIARIVESEDEVEKQGGIERTNKSNAATIQHPEPVSAPPPQRDTVPTSIVPELQNQQRQWVGPRHKILASPLAKRLASERGIDLSMLQDRGVVEPIHAADLSRMVTGGQSQIVAKVDGSILTAFLDRSAEADRTKLFAAFASSSWRAIFDADAVPISILGLDGTTTLYGDRGAVGTDGSPMLSLIDLCDTRLSFLALAQSGNTLAIAQDGDTFFLTLSFNQRVLPLQKAIALLDAIAARVEEPILLLL